MSHNKRRFAGVIGAATLCLLAAPAAGQTTSGWEFQLDLLRMDVKGADAHTGDVVRLTETQTLNPPQLSDRVTHTPIDLDMAAKNTIRAELKHRGQTWGAGVSGWFLRTDDAESGHVHPLRAGRLSFGGLRDPHEGESGVVRRGGEPSRTSGGPATTDREGADGGPDPR